MNRSTLPRLVIEDLRRMGVEVELVSSERSPVEIHLRFPPGTSDEFVEVVREVLRPYCDETLQILLEGDENPAGGAGAPSSQTGDGLSETGGN